MTLEDPVLFLQRMLEIYSPSGKEEQIAHFIIDEMKSLGFRNVRISSAGNVYGEIGSGSRSILLCGHMDTVPGRIPVKLEGDRLYGRGAVDAKSSLAAMIWASASLKPNIQRLGRVIVAGVVEEERNARGIRQLLHEGFDVECAVFGEPSGLKNITFAYKGRIYMQVICKTRTGHVGAQHMFRNAIEAAFDLWSRVKNTCLKYQSPYGIFYSLTPSLMRINSRRSAGGIPDKCFLEIDLRLPPKIRSTEAVSLVNKVIEEFETENDSVSVSLRTKDVVEPFVAKRDTFLMKALRESIYEVTGEPAKFLRKTGTGDMNIFGAERKVPVATYGPGDSSLSHTICEYIEIPEYLKSIEVYKRTVEKILSKP